MKFIIVCNMLYHVTVVFLPPPLELPYINNVGGVYVAQAQGLVKTTMTWRQPVVTMMRACRPLCLQYANLSSAAASQVTKQAEPKPFSDIPGTVTQSHSAICQWGEGGVAETLPLLNLPLVAVSVIIADDMKVRYCYSWSGKFYRYFWWPYKGKSQV